MRRYDENRCQNGEIVKGFLFIEYSFTREPNSLHLRQILAISQLIRNMRNYYDTISGDKSIYLVDIGIAKSVQMIILFNLLYRG